MLWVAPSPPSSSSLRPADANAELGNQINVLVHVVQVRTPRLCDSSITLGDMQITLILLGFISFYR